MSTTINFHHELYNILVYYSPNLDISHPLIVYELYVTTQEAVPQSI